MEDEVERLRLRLWDAETALDRALDEIEMLTSKIGSLAACQAEADLLERRLRLMHESTSWKATAPLRSMARSSKALSRRLRATRSSRPLVDHGNMMQSDEADASQQTVHPGHMTALERSILRQLEPVGPSHQSLLPEPS